MLRSPVITISLSFNCGSDKIDKRASKKEAIFPWGGLYMPMMKICRELISICTTQVSKTSEL